jgi:hypothetical protein
MDRWVTAAQRGIAVIIAAASAVAFAQSYRGLVDWAAAHQVPAQWTWTWPLMVDSFLALGELRLFIAAVRGAPWRVRMWAWCVTVGGLAISVAGNVGHLAVADPASRATAAVPPLAAAVALGIGLGLVKHQPPSAVTQAATPHRRLRPLAWVRIPRIPLAWPWRHRPTEDRQDGPPAGDPPPPDDRLPSPDQVLLAVLAAEAAEGTLRMSRRAVHERHSISEWKADHLLKQLASASNGHAH